MNLKHSRAAQILVICLLSTPDVTEEAAHAVVPVGTDSARVAQITDVGFSIIDLCSENIIRAAERCEEICTSASAFSFDPGFCGLGSECSCGP